MKRTNTAPVHSIKVGCIQAGIWETVARGRHRHSVVLSRIYRGPAGWQRSRSFNLAELRSVRVAAERAQVWIANRLNRPV